MDATERRAEIIKILRGRKRETMQNLAFQLGVTDRTIRHDILILTAVYPLETFKGNGGGVALMNDPYKNLLSHKQQQTIISMLDRADKQETEVLCSIIRAYGSKEYQQKLEGGT